MLLIEFTVFPLLNLTKLGAKDVKEIGSILGGQEDVKPGTDPKDEVTSPLPLKKRDADKAFRLPGVPTKGPKVCFIKFFLFITVKVLLNSYYYL